MKIEKKLAIIGVIAVITSVILFFVSHADSKSKGLIGNILDVFIATILVFIVLSVNFFALSFLIKLIRKRL